ncbi:Factor arrest protein 8 [Nakaseomyces bracarensis]|uniref:Factor arrest protein 8 n=1 Tax=Nakaseomyces bracarensis TaxID=273131 RepID=A0ABR4NQR0_9SACH
MAHYTLPGVMHYLQTEFTKNERDRITWELERAEMKTRITELENENNELRYQMNKLKLEEGNGKDHEGNKTNTSSTGLSPLIRSKAAVQENVKEIVYLLKSPNANDQIESLKNKANANYQVSKMALNTTDNRSKPTREITKRRESGSKQNVSHRQANHSTNIRESNVEDRLNEQKFELEEVSDAETEVVSSDHEETTMRKAAQVASLFENESTEFKTTKVVKPPTSVRKLKVQKDQIVMYNSNGDLVNVKVGQDFNLSSPTTYTLNGVSDTVLDYFVVSDNQVLTIDESGLKLWELGVSKCISHMNIFEDGHVKLIDYRDIIHVDFKNKWLLFATKENVVIIEVVIMRSSVPSKLAINKKHMVETYKNILDIVLGMTEKSFITICGPPYELVIYNFQGEILQTISIEKHMAGTMLLSDESARTSFKLNKETSKLLIQVNNIILVYSFDQKAIVLKRLLKSIPTTVLFGSVNDIVILAYSSRRIEFRTLSRFDYIQKVLTGEGEGPTEEVEELSLTGKTFKDQIDALSCPLDVVTLNNKLMLATVGHSGTLSLHSLMNLR